MAAKDILVQTLGPPVGTLFTHNVDFADFYPGWLILFFDATNIRLHYSWQFNNLHRVIISPAGVAYPGDAAFGNGAKKVSFNFNGPPAPVVMTRVDDVNFANGWAVVIKGEHIIAYVPNIVSTVQVEPTT